MEEDGVAMMVVRFPASCAATVAVEMVDSKLVRYCVAMDDGGFAPATFMVANGVRESGSGVPQ